MKNVQKKIMLTHQEYELLNGYIRRFQSAGSSDKENAQKLQQELKRAVLVGEDKIPGNVVRLNSKVVIKDTLQNKLMELMLVLPEYAALKEKKISVFAPIGTALIGFGEGEQVQWEVPSGNRTFTILKVSN